MVWLYISFRLKVDDPQNSERRIDLPGLRTADLSQAMGVFAARVVFS